MTDGIRIVFEDVAKRFDAYDWNVIRVSNANDLGELAAAYKDFLAHAQQPISIFPLKFSDICS